MKTNRKKRILSIAVPLLTGGLAAFLTKDGMAAFVCANGDFLLSDNHIRKYTGANTAGNRNLFVATLFSFLLAFVILWGCLIFCCIFVADCAVDSYCDYDIAVWEIG